MFEIGSSLREARSRGQIGIAQVEQATKIRGKYLRALEEEQFDVLPSQTYVKGFLRTYADYLGLDGQLYVDEYNSRFGSGEEWGPRSARRAASRRRERRLQANVVLLTLGAIVVLTVVVISAWKASGSGHVVTPPKPHTTPRPAAAPGPYLEITAVRGSSKVIVNRAGATGKILFEGTLERGDTQAFNGKRFWLNVGAPENLVITVAGKRVHVAGYRPWVLTITPAGWRGHAA
jgi:Helix-turn-helix domain/RodZ C-terminal domain